MANREISSLDRFVNSRAPVLMGITDESRRLLAVGLMAGAYGGFGISFLIAAMASGDAHQTLALALQGAAFLAGSGLMAGIRAWMKQRLKDQPTSHVELTPEAGTLVRSLITHVEGWSFHPRRRRRILRRAMRRGLLRSFHNRRSEDVLAPRVFQLLDGAAAEYNRIYGALALGSPFANATLERLAPNIRAATDEAMAEVLHAGALLEKYPESASRLEAQAQGGTEDLKELADQVARLQSSAEAPVGVEGASPRIRSVLEELRADQRAREELGQSPMPAEVQRLYRAP